MCIALHMQRHARFFSANNRLNGFLKCVSVLSEPPHSCPTSLAWLLFRDHYNLYIVSQIVIIIIHDQLANLSIYIAEIQFKNYPRIGQNP